MLKRPCVLFILLCMLFSCIGFSAMAQALEEAQNDGVITLFEATPTPLPLRSGELILDNFENSVVGSVPVGYALGNTGYINGAQSGGKIAESISGANGRCMEIYTKSPLSLQMASLYKGFSIQSEKTIFEFDYMVPSTAGNKSLALSITNGTTFPPAVNMFMTATSVGTFGDGAVSTTQVTGLKENAWHHIKAEIYPMAGSRNYDLYVDGMLASRGIAFRSTTVTSISALYFINSNSTAEGTAYVDNVKLYKPGALYGVDSTTYQDASNGQVISAPTAGMVVSAEVVAHNYTGTSENAQLMVAAYSGNKLVTMSHSPITLAADTTKTYYSSLIMPNTLPAGTITFKTFVWGAFCGSDFFTSTPLTTNLYVDGSVLSSGDGSEAQPFKTILEAKNYVRNISSGMNQDIVVCIAPGDYSISQTMVFGSADSGQNGKKIIYRAQGAPGSVRLIGAKALTNWVQDTSPGVWKTQVGTASAFYTLYENNERATKARYPDREYDVEYPTSKAPYLLTNDTDTNNYQTIKYKSTDLSSFSFSDISQANIVIWPWNKCDWQMWVNPIVSINKASSTIVPQFTVGVSGGTIGTNIPFGLNARYYIEGMKELLNSPGEFHLDTTAGTLYYYPKYGNPNTQTQVYAPTVHRIIQLLGTSDANPVKNLVFEGLSFEMTDFVRGSKGWFEAGMDSVMQMGALEMQNAWDNQIIQCQFKNIGLTGIFMKNYSKRNIVSGCNFQSLGNSGIILKGSLGEYVSNNSITNCLFRSMGETSVDCAGINIFIGQSNTISNVEVYDSPRYGISVRGGAASFGWFTRPADLNNEKYGGRSRNNTVQNALLHHTNQDSGDTGSLHGAGISFETVPYNVNTFENISIDHVYAHPSMQDISPNGLFFDYQTFGQRFKNVMVTDNNGYPGTQSDPAFTSNTQLRYNESGGATYDNCSWYEHFDKSLMDYDSIGLLPSFPAEFLPGTEKARGGLALQVGAAKAVHLGSVEPITGNARPFLSDGVPMVPLSYVASAFDATTTNTGGNVFSVTKMATTAQLTVGSTTMVVNSVPKTIPKAPTLLGTVLYVPATAVSDILGISIFTDNGTVVYAGAPLDALRDRKALERLGEMLLLHFQPSEFQYETVTGSVLREFTAQYTVDTQGKGLLLRNTGTINSPLIGVVYEAGIGFRIYSRQDPYSIPTYQDTGITTLPATVKLSKISDNLQFSINNTVIYSEKNSWAQPLVGGFGPGATKPQVAIGGLSLPNNETVQNVTISTSNKTIETGKSGHLLTKIISNVGTVYIMDEALTYTSSNPAVISIEQGNYAAAKSLGAARISTNITVCGNNYSPYIDMTVLDYNPVLINETFETNSDSLQNWTFSSSNNAGSYAKIEGGMLKVYANAPGTHHGAYDIDDTGDIITVECDYKASFAEAEAGSGSMPIYLLSPSGTFAVSLFGSKGTSTTGEFTYYGGTQSIGTFTYNTVCRIKLVANVPTNTFDFYVNGVRKGQDLPFRNTVTQIGSLWFGSNANSENATIWWDNITATKQKP